MAIDLAEINRVTAERMVPQENVVPLDTETTGTAGTWAGLTRAAEEDPFYYRMMIESRQDQQRAQQHRAAYAANVTQPRRRGTVSQWRSITPSAVDAPAPPAPAPAPDPIEEILLMKLDGTTVVKEVGFEYDDPVWREAAETPSSRASYRAGQAFDVTSMATYTITTFHRTQTKDWEGRVVYLEERA